jgi:hypothetical protein
MRTHSIALTVVSFLILVTAAATVLDVDANWDRDDQQASREFQELVGGLGFGPAVDLSTCSYSFDPRVCSNCPHDLGPIPGGVYFCPQHACSILYYPPVNCSVDIPEESLPHGLSR